MNSPPRLLLGSSSPSTVDAIDGSSLSYFIPLATEFDLDQVLKAPEGGSIQSRLDAVEPRDVLFFGMANLQHPGLPFLTCSFPDAR